MTEEEVLEVLKCIKEDKSPRPVQVFARVEILASTIVTVGASRLKYGILRKAANQKSAKPDLHQCLHQVIGGDSER